MIFRKICEHCGKEFTAQKQTTKYCSTYCSSRARKDRIKSERLQSVRTSDIKGYERLRNKEVLSPSMAATFLGVNRSTIYRYISAGLLRVARAPGRTLILREDLDNLFTKARLMLPTESTASYISVSEAADMFAMTSSGCYKYLKKAGLKQVRKGKLFFYVREQAVKALVLREQGLHPEIEEWYTREEIISIYHMTDSAVSRMVKDYGIPWKRIKNVYYYSMAHVDAVKRAPIVPMKEEYYSVKDAMAKYSLSRDMVYHYFKQNGIKRIQVGNYVYFRKKDFDAIFAIPEFDL